MHHHAAMKNTSVTLGEHFDRYITEQLKTGRFRSASEIIREGLRLLEEREYRIAALRSALVAGEESGFAEYSLDELNKEIDSRSD